MLRKKISAAALAALLVLEGSFAFVPAQAVREEETDPPLLWDDDVCPRGDVVRDDVLLAEDARLILRASVDPETFSPETALLADVDNDGAVTASDARFVLRMSVSLEPLFSHVPGPPATTEAPQVCLVCGKELAPKLPDPYQYTKNGFRIEEKDGITYIDGVMVVNKTYSLPASYAPGDLHQDCYDAFYRMAAAARRQGLSLYIASGYRSYALQQSLFTRYCNRDGVAAAERYSARPGFSEHQSGYAIDLNSITNSFANTSEGRWVAAHCWEYGFILRYPKGKEWATGYMHEPWHIRYVGTALSLTLRDNGLTLEEYFGITSVYPWDL